MRQKKAKALKLQAYGSDYSPKHRKYKIKGRQIIADSRRQLYQALKGRRPHALKYIKNSIKGARE